MKRMKISVVGGGIGGLSAANALVAQGFEVRVYEQAPQFGEVGAGVMLTPNGIRHLEHWGLAGALREWGSPIGKDSFYYRSDGTRIATVQVSDSSGGRGIIGMHRADLVQMLANNLPLGVLNTGKRCTHFEQHQAGTRLHFDDGFVDEADLVVAADGIHSTLQSYVVQPAKPVFSGTMAYRGTILHEQYAGWPTDSWEMWLGARKHFLVFPLRAGKIINFVGFVPADKEMQESWSAPGDPAQLRSEFEGWDERLVRLLDMVGTTFRWGLYDREPLTRWVNGKLILLGDAAHPMLPHLGQGANQSIEDAMALATVLSSERHDSLDAGLQAYEVSRLARTAHIQASARENGLRYDSVYGDLGVRDAEITSHAEFRRSLYDYDVISELAAGT